MRLVHITNGAHLIMPRPCGILASKYSRECYDNLFHVCIDQESLKPPR